MDNRSNDLDETDLRILAVQGRDGRITNQALAERIGLSPSSCLRRVQILERRGVIRGYTVILDDSFLGKTTTVIVRIALERQTGDYLERFESAVRQCPDVIECDLMSGESDYLLRVTARDTRDFERIHKEQLSCLPGVARIQSSFAIRSIVKRQAAG